MLDLHCHLLPGVDDGPATWEESLALARSLVEQGVRGVVAAPHFIPGRLPDVARTAQLTAELGERLRQAGLPLTVYPGAEAYLDPDLPRLLAEGHLPTLNHQPCLLVELPLEDLPPYTGEVLFQLQLAGVTPVLAHPERNRALAENPALLAEFVQKGALAQLNAGSLLGHFGPQVERAASLAVRQGLAHFLGSDAHDAVRRPPALARARAAVTRLAGAEAAQLLTWTNPARCLAGEEIVALEARREKKRPFWRRRG